MRYLILLIILLPLAALAQDFQFELQPDAFPLTINGFQPYQPWAGGMENTKPELCDLDHDGDLDIFIGEYAGYVKYYKNVGSVNQPEFIFVTDFFDSLQSPTPGYPSDVEFVDMNGDGLLDAVIGGKQGVWSRVMVYINHGTPTMPNYSSPPDTLRDDSGNDVHGRRKATVDIDGDGNYDIIDGEYDGTIRFYKNIGTPSNYIFHLESLTWMDINLPDGETDPTFADLDSDGDLDLLIGTGNGQIYYYRNDGTPQVPQMTLVSSNYFGIDVGNDASPELADIDGDGDLDLFVGRSLQWDSLYDEGDIYFYENTGNSSVPNFLFVTTDYLTFDIGQFTGPRLVDIDADGDPDLLTAIGSRIGLFRNQGTLSMPRFIFETDTFANIILPWGCTTWFVDLDADGDYDLLASTGAIPGPPGLYYYRNQGTPQVPNYVLVTSNLLPGIFTQSSVLLYPVTADIDGDGDQDLFITDNDAAGYFYFFRNVGTPTNYQFQYVTNNWQNLLGTFGSGKRFAFYDIDRDGDLDLFLERNTSIYDPWNKNLRFYRNVGTPQNANIQLEIEDMFPELMICGSCPFLIDMDRDGDGDLFVGDQFGGCRFFRNVTGETHVNVTLTPAHPPITIPVSGGNFRYNIAVTNPTQSPHPTDFWVMVQFPNGSWHGPAYGPVNRNLSPGANLSRNRTQNVPAGAPAGTYHYEGRVGVYPDSVWARSSFAVVKQEGGMLLDDAVGRSMCQEGLPDSGQAGMTYSLTGWESYGEEFGEDPWLTNGDLPISPSLQLNISPNPANPLAVIQFNVPIASNVNLTVFDVTGREVARLIDGKRQAGPQSITFDGASLSSGIYLVRLQTGQDYQTQKVVVVK
jgi:hypothetical protein